MNETSIFLVARAIHIAFGTIALFVAPIAMATRKGGPAHRRWGKVFFWSITGVAATALVMSLTRSGLFFFLIAIFSFYLAFTGYRVLYRKSPKQRATWPDRISATVMMSGAVALIVYGGYQMSIDGFGAVPLTFGVIGIFLLIADLRSFRTPSKDKRAWWYTHMARMLAAYIAAVTAFSVVNFRFLSDVTRWLWPSVVGTIAVYVWVGYYKKKFAAANRTSTGIDGAEPGARAD